MEVEDVKSIARLESDIRHINIHIEGIKDGMKQIQDLILEQNDMRNELSVFLREHTEIKRLQSDLGIRIKSVEDKTLEIDHEVKNFVSKVKINVFDYIWKYGALAVGGWIALKVTGILP